MTALDKNPLNQSMLSPLNFYMAVKRSPNVNWYLQKVNLPGVSLPPTDYFTPQLGIPEYGDGVHWENLVIEYKVDEDLNSWFEVFNWLIAIGAPENTNQFKQIENMPQFSGEGITSDISISILDSNENPNFTIFYKDAFPVSLAGLNFNTTATDVNYITTTAIFKYSYYEILKDKK